MWAAVRATNEQNIPVWYIHESLVARQLIAPNRKFALGIADVRHADSPDRAALAAYTDRPIEVVPYGIPPRIPWLATGDPALMRFLLLGTYEPRKGQDVFLDAIKQLPSSTLSRASFQMAGRVLDHSFHEALTRQAAALPSITLRGALSHDEALAASAATDVLVCASRDETMPIAILEAMSQGKAIVATKVGGVAEWLRDRVNALLVPLDDDRALAGALRRCLDEPGLIKSLGENARQTFFEHFSIDRLGERFAALFEQARRKKRT